MQRNLQARGVFHPLLLECMYVAFIFALRCVLVTQSDDKQAAPVGRHQRVIRGKRQRKPDRVSDPDSDQEDAAWEDALQLAGVRGNFDVSDG